jgi:hypothetical protein
MTYNLPDELRVAADGPVRIVTINRPEHRNAVNAALHRALAQVWRQLSADTGAQAVILTGAGRTFCAGGDFELISSFATDPAARYESLREGAEIIEEMLRSTAQPSAWAAALPCCATSCWCRHKHISPIRTSRWAWWPVTGEQPSGRFSRRSCARGSTC